MDLNTIRQQPDKTVITTPVTGVLSNVYPMEQTSHPQYGAGTKQGAVLDMGGDSIRVEFRDFGQDVSGYKGQQITLTYSQTQHGPRGLTVNRYFSQAKGQEMISLRVTSTGNLAGASGAPQQAPQGQPTPPPQQAYQQATAAPSSPSATRPAGQAVGSALNNATSLLIAEGITTPTERQLWEKASIYLVVAEQLEAGKINRPAPKQMPGAAPTQQTAAPTPPPQQLPPQPTDAEVRDEDVSYDDTDVPF